MTHGCENTAYDAEPLYAGPHGFARRISAYISDPSTVRARCVERYDRNRCPSIEQIKAMQESHHKQSRYGNYNHQRDYTKSPKAWTIDDTESLKLLRQAGWTYADLAEHFNRTIEAVRDKLRDKRPSRRAL